MPAETFIPSIIVAYVWFFMFIAKHPTASTALPILSLLVSITFIFLSYLSDKKWRITAIQLAVLFLSFLPVFLVYFGLL